MEERLTRTGLYPLGENLTWKECLRLGVDPKKVFHPEVRAEWTGERRPPRAGEWYLSGSPIDAYRAPNDLTQEFHIARLVLTRTIPARIVRE